MGFVRAEVVGAGMAGLAAAVELTVAGVPVALSEAGPRAGGRCRSYFDPSLGLTIDGNHLVLAGNPAVARFRNLIGAGEPLAGPDHADFAFADLATGERWTLRINDGPVPWWVLCHHAGCRGRVWPIICRWAACSRGGRIRPSAIW
jgi:cation diffusion facilitator CzcD-associated flavoprotein CzcO